jgi:hypothetical protein
MAKIELARSTDGRETILRVKGARAFPDKPHIRIGWIGTNKSLGPSGWENAPYLIRTSSLRDSEDLLITLDASVTNHILPGTPIEISIRDLELSEQLLWPAQLPGAVPVGAGPDPVSPGHRAALENALVEAEKLRAELDVVRGQLLDSQKGLQEAKDGPPDEPRSPSTPPPGTDWRKVLAAFMVGIGLGAGGMYAHDLFGATGEPTTAAQFQRDIARLRTEAFAPLADDLVQIAERSPKGQTPDEIAGEGAPPGKVEERALKFLDHGMEMARGGDAAEAVYWYRQALRLCQADSMFYLGDAYLSGDGARRDSQTGFQLMRTSSALGSRRATEHVRELLQRQQILLAPPTIGDLYQRRVSSQP